MENKKLDIVKKSMVSIGFTIEEAEIQIVQVGKLVTMAILERLLKERAEIRDFTPDNLEDYLKKNFTAPYLKTVVEVESGRIVDGYLKSISQNLPPDVKDNFYQEIQAEN